MRISTVWTLLGALATADAFLIWPESIPTIDLEKITEPIKPYVADLANLIPGGDKKHQVLNVECHECLEPGKVASLIYDFKISNMKGETPRILINGGDFTPAADMSFSFVPPSTLSVPLVNSDFTLADMIETDAEVIEVPVDYHWSYTWKFGPPEYNQPVTVDSDNVVIGIQPTSINGQPISSDRTPRVAVEVVSDAATGDMTIAKVGLWEDMKQNKTTWGEMTYEAADNSECDSTLCQLMDEVFGWGSIASEKISTWGSVAGEKVGTWGQKIGEKVTGCHKPKPEPSVEAVAEDDEQLQYSDGWYDEDQDWEFVDGEEPSWIAIVVTWITFTVLACIVGYGLGALTGLILSPVILLISFCLYKLFGTKRVRDEEQAKEGDDSGKGLLADQEAPPAYEEEVEVGGEKN